MTAINLHLFMQVGDDITRIAETVSNTDVNVLVMVSVLAVLSLIAFVSWVIYRGLAIAGTVGNRLAEKIGDYLDKDSERRDELNTTLKSIQRTEANQTLLIQRQIEIMDDVQGRQKKQQSDIEAAHETTKNVQAAVNEGFDRTTAAIDRLPTRIMDEIKPYLSKLDDIQTTVEQSQETSMAAHTELKQQITTTREMILAKLDTALAVSRTANPNNPSEEEKAA